MLQFLLLETPSDNLSQLDIATAVAVPVLIILCIVGVVTFVGLVVHQRRSKKQEFKGETVTKPRY